MVEALAVNLASPLIPESHVKVFPLEIVATKTCPQLLRDHKPGSSETLEALTASPHPFQSVAS